MRWLFAAAFGVIGGALSYSLFGEPTVRGELGRQIDTFSVGLGMVLAAPIGFLIGSLPIFSPQPAPPETPQKRFSPQVAGRPCSVCGETIVFADEGTFCQPCEIVFHSACTHDGACPSCGK